MSLTFLKRIKVVWQGLSNLFVFLIFSVFDKLHLYILYGKNKTNFFLWNKEKYSGRRSWMGRQGLGKLYKGEGGFLGDWPWAGDEPSEAVGGCAWSRGIPTCFPVPAYQYPIYPRIHNNRAWGQPEPPPHYLPAQHQWVRCACACSLFCPKIFKLWENTPNTNLPS